MASDQMSLQFKWPATCKIITQGYGVKNSRYVSGYHTGLDIGCMSGSPIYAAHDGKVTFAGPNGAYGNQVRLALNSSLTTTYNHMSRIAATVGQNVSAGTIIGYIGNTGNSTGPHLHFEVQINGQHVDPNPYLSGATVIPGGSTGTATQAGFTSSISNLGKAVDWITDTHNWLRIGIVALGGILLLMALIGLSGVKGMTDKALGMAKEAGKKVNTNGGKA